MDVRRRVSELESEREAERRRAADASRRILRRLSDRELAALIGAPEAWESLSDAEVEAVARGELEGPEEAVGYAPPAWVRRRLREVASERELRDAGLWEECGDVQS